MATVILQIQPNELGVELLCFQHQQIQFTELILINGFLEIVIWSLPTTDFTSVI